ncbi:MAG: aminotransferase class I/II-fold pyridoxal phosphate-dependent enzyme [Cyanothece sp. SIO1E1]|nr:aminotransferase class I/II-fold pyridoxal phosphate-dependent enzyme [Cyanothece sp. SIO1E1]
MPLTHYVEALQTAIVPHNPDWFAYKQSESEAQSVISISLSERLRHPFEADDICMTNGAVAGLYIAPQQMPHRLELRNAINLMQMFAGWAFPNAILQYAVADLVGLSIDIEQLQARRDRFIQALDKIGYETFKPDGTFYLLVRSPLIDDWEFIEQLAQHDVFCLPGITFGLPGYFRISLTCSDEMVERSIPKFALVFQSVA